MNRQLKFRVWHKKSKEWCGTIGLNESISQNELEYDTDDLVFVQYTGLNDSNDDSIYEGDILINHYDVGNNIIGQVLYESDHGGYIFQWKRIRKGRGQDYNNLNCDVAFESVIVGNIFEHSELLK